MSVTGTGAPAESIIEIWLRAARCWALSSCAVATTLRKAAGEAKIIVVSPAMDATAGAAAVRVAGIVTDILGVTDVAPIAGPNSANGANSANKLAPGTTLSVSCRR